MRVMSAAGGANPQGTQQGTATSNPHDSPERPNLSDPRDTRRDPAAPTSVQDSARTPETLFDNRQ